MSEASVAEVEEQDVTAEAAEALCSHCGRTEPWTESEWCPSCGYSQRFGRVFDLGQTSEEWSELDAADLGEAVPPWLRILLGGVVSIIAMSIAARFTLPVEVRAAWTILQLLAAMAAFGVGHFTAYLYATAESDKFGPFDLLMKPGGLWRPTFRDLPEHAWRTWVAAWGITGFLAALFLVGGINWMGIFEADWGFKKSAKGNLLHEVVKRAREERDAGAESMEEALDEFAGEEEETKPEKKFTKREADAIVVGYTKNGDGGVSSLLLASMYRRKLVYAGPIEFRSLPPEVREEFMKVLTKLERPTPFVDATVSGGIWLHPVKLLRVKFTSFTTRGRMRDVEFDELLENLR